MVKLHFLICIFFFVFGFGMRYGLMHNLMMFFYKTIPKLHRKPFVEYDVRRFLGETSIKMGSIIFLIAIVGIVSPDDLFMAILLGWLCFFIITAASVTSLIDRVDIFDKRRVAKQKAKYGKRP